MGRAVSQVSIELILNKLELGTGVATTAAGVGSGLGLGWAEAVGVGVGVETTSAGTESSPGCVSTDLAKTVKVISELKINKATAVSLIYFCFCFLVINFFIPLTLFAEGTGFEPAKP